MLHAESGFDWSELQAHAASLSLFAERRLIDLRLPGGSPGKDGGPVLAQYAADPPPDTVLLLSCGRLDRRSTATKWFKALEGAGDVIEVFPVRAATSRAGSSIAAARAASRSSATRPGCWRNATKAISSPAHRRSTSSASSRRDARSRWKR